MYSLFAVAAVSGLLIAGCGGSSKSSTTKTTSSTTSSATISTTTSSSTSSSAVSSLNLTPAEAAAAGTACQKELSLEGTILNGSAKSLLQTVCNDYKNDNVAGAEAAVKQYCKALASNSSIPASVRATLAADCSKLP
jgi:hypothetical protein